MAVRKPFEIDDASILVSESLTENNAGITGQTITYTVQRISDGFWWDFTNNQWDALYADPGTKTDTMAPGSGEVDATNLPGEYAKAFTANSLLDTEEEYRVHTYIAAGIYAFDSYYEFYPLTTTDVQADVTELLKWRTNKIAIIKDGAEFYLQLYDDDNTTVLRKKLLQTFNNTPIGELEGTLTPSIEDQSSI